MNDNVVIRWRGNFFAGLAIVLPAVISIGVLIWLFGTISNVTDTLLFFLPTTWTHKNHGNGPVHWYWSLVAFVFAVVIISLIGRAARHYFGKKAIEWADIALLRIPLLNKIYGTVKQVNDAFSSNKSSFKQVVLIAFPHPGSYSIGFVTAEQQLPMVKSDQKFLSVFVPTTPNPTSGFLMLVPEKDIIKLDMSVADGIKFIISLGSIAPDQQKAQISALKANG